MNILFIGNSYVYASLRFLTPIFNRFPSYKFDNLDIDFLYIASGSVDVFANNFNSSLSNKLSGSFSVAKIPNVLYHYKYGEVRLLEDRMPDITISEIIKSKQYDIIVLGICVSMNKITLIRDECYTYYKSFVNNIRKISDAKLYLFETACLRDLPGDKMYEPFSDWFYTGKFAVCKNRNEMYEHLNKLEAFICKKLNLDVIPIRNAFRYFRKYFDNEFKLFVDVHHPDVGIGRYVYFVILYYSIFYTILDVDLKDIPFIYKCKNTDTQYTENKKCIDITPHNKALVDNVIKKYIIHDKN